MLVFGAGNVAYSVVPALQAVNGDSGVEVYSRSERSAAALGAAYGVEWHSGSWMPGGAYTVCVVAVPDDAVRTSVERLEGDGRLVIHMSGSVPAVPLARGMSGVMYPLQSFAKGSAAICGRFRYSWRVRMVLPTMRFLRWRLKFRAKCGR